MLWRDSNAGNVILIVIQRRSSFGELAPDARIRKKRARICKTSKARISVGFQDLQKTSEDLQKKNEDSQSPKTVVLCVCECEDSQFPK